MPPKEAAVCPTKVGQTEGHVPPSLSSFSCQDPSSPPLSLVYFIRLLGMRLVWCDTLWETLRWTFHAWWHGYWVPTDVATWTSTRDTTIPFVEEILITKKRWPLLAPFFASRGYHLYEPGVRLGETHPPNSPKIEPAVDEGYPYAPHRLWNDKGYIFDRIQGCRVWAARDYAGREVVVKLVSAPGLASDELAIWQRLNTPTARADPRNRTLPALDFITYNGLVFVVTPRWGNSMVGLPFATIEQLLVMADQLYEGMAFLHEHRIAHRDVGGSNTVMNTLYEELEGHDPVQIRNSDHVRYAFIDFEASALFSMDTDISNVTMDREMRIPTEWAGLKEGRSNPFVDDVYVLTNTLQRWVRVAEGVVPEIGQFFEEILRDYSSTPTADVALQRLRRIKASLTPEQLASPSPGRIWENGETKQ